MSGTDFSSLTATPDSVSNRDPLQMQGLMQQLGPQIEALLQLLLMLQQLFAGQQQNNSAGAGRGGGADMPGTSAEEGLRSPHRLMPRCSSLLTRLNPLLHSNR